MRLATPKQMNEIDTYTIDSLGVPGIVLMENAALRVVEVVVNVLDGAVKGRKLLILAGKGNNGGDAFAVARHLLLMGAKVDVYLLAGKNSISGDAKTNLDILGKLDMKVHELLDDSMPASFSEELNNSEIIIDGIFGTGFRGKPEGVAEKVIEQINISKKVVVSIDIPSGVNGETGKVPGICIKASVTVTFQLPKPGLVLHPGCDHVGKLVVADIGIPGMAIDHQEIKMYVLSNNSIINAQGSTGNNCYDAEMASLLPVRTLNSNKGDYGKLFIITGSTGMTGSGCLSAEAALRIGAGLVYVGVPSSLSCIYGSVLREPILIPLEDSGKGSLITNCMEEISNKMERMDIVAVGPGLSVTDDTKAVVRGIIRKCKVPLVLDADALNAVASDVSILNELKVDTVITPHPGEMARLTGITIDEVQADRIKAAGEFASKWKLIVVLKGSRTIIALPDGKIFVNTSGNPGMATGGSGDVLTGIITGLAGQGLKLSDAAVLGVYLHGLAGDAAAGKRGMNGMIAGDIIEELPYVLKSLGY